MLPTSAYSSIGLRNYAVILHSALWNGVVGVPLSYHIPWWWSLSNQAKSTTFQVSSLGIGPRSSTHGVNAALLTRNDTKWHDIIWHDMSHLRRPLIWVSSRCAASLCSTCSSKSRCNLRFAALSLVTSSSVSSSCRLRCFTRWLTFSTWKPTNKTRLVSHDK